MRNGHPTHLLLRAVVAVVLLVVLSSFGMFAQTTGGIFNCQGGACPQVIDGLTLSTSTFPAGGASGTVVGTLNVLMGPATPAFTGTYQISGPDALKFQTVGNSLETNGVVGIGTYNISIAPQQTGTVNGSFGPIPFTLVAQQSIQSINLSNNTFPGGSASGTVVGALTVTMTPSSPAFTGSLALTGTDAASFQLVGAGCANGGACSLATNGVLAVGTYSVSIVATQAGVFNSPLTTAPQTITGTQSIATVALSNNSFAGGSASGTVVGTVSVTMNPTSPAFSGSLSLTGANAANFQLAGSSLETSGVLAAGTYNLNVVATEASATNSPFSQPEVITGSCALGSSFADGCAGAPVGTAQLAGLLTTTAITGYAHPYCTTRTGFFINQSTGATTSTPCTPWNVAGVDYHVGYPSTTTLCNAPFTTAQGCASNLPAGATYQTNYARPNTTVTAALVLNTPGGTVSGLNLDGVEIIHLGGNWTVQNSYSKVEAANTTTCGEREDGTPTSFCGTAVYSPATGANLTLLNYEADGNNVATTAQQSQLIDLENSGTGVTNTLQYVYAHDAGEDCLDMFNGSQAIVVQYTVFRNCGVQQIPSGAGHGDAVQWVINNTVPNAVLSFVTEINDKAIVGGGQGALELEVENTGDSMKNGLLENASIFRLPVCNSVTSSACNWTLGIDIQAGSGDHWTVKNVYMDPTADLNFTGMWLLANHFYGYNFGHPTTIANTVDITTGAVHTTYPSASPFGSAVPDASGYTPPMADIYTINCSTNCSGNFTTGQTITFKLCMDDTYTVTGTPRLVLNSGASAFANYASGSGTTSCTDANGTGTRSSALTFNYTIGAGDSAATLAVNSIALNGGSIVDGVGNAAILTPLNNLTTSFTGLSVNQTASVSSVSLSNSTFTAGTAGTVGTASATLSSGSPTGTWSLTTTGTDHAGTACVNYGSDFSIASSTGVLSNTTTPTAGSYPGTCITYTQAGLSNSPYTQAFTLTGSAPGGCPLGANPGGVVDGCTAGAGVTGPSSGTPNLATIFSAYPARAGTCTVTVASGPSAGTNCRPPWNVPGVDYHVGMPAGQTLTPIASLSNPNITRNSSAHSASISSCPGNALTLSGIDFTGWFLITSTGINGCTITITNSKFNCDASGNPQHFTFIQEQGSNTWIIKYDDILQQNCPVWPNNVSDPISVSNVTIQYVHIINQSEHFMGAGDMASTLDMRFNEIDGVGDVGTGAHENCLQWFGTTGTNTGSKFNNNLLYQTTGNGGGECPQWYSNDSATPSFVSPQTNNNVFIAHSGSTLMSFAVHGACHTSSPPCNPTTSGQLNSNYVDFSGMLGPFYVGTLTPTQGWSATGNIDLTTGNTITPN